MVPKKFSPFSVDSLLSHREKAESKDIKTETSSEPAMTKFLLNNNLFRTRSTDALDASDTKDGSKTPLFRPHLPTEDQIKEESQRSEPSPSPSGPPDDDEDVNVDDSDDEEALGKSASLPSGGHHVLQPRFPLGFPITSSPWSTTTGGPTGPGTSLPRPSPSFPWLPHLRSPLGLPGFIPSKYFLKKLPPFKQKRLI